MGYLSGAVDIVQVIHRELMTCVFLKHGVVNQRIFAVSSPNTSKIVNFVAPPRWSDNQSVFHVTQNKCSAVISHQAETNLE